MNHADVSAAARLIRHALTPKERPTAESEYRDLLDRYQTDIPFAELVERIAEGLGLDVHPPSQLGLLISGRIESPFAVTLENSGLPLRPNAEQRLHDRRCFGLVLLAIVAYCYPNGEALVDASTRPVRAVEVERFLDQRIKRLTAIDADPELPESQLRAAAEGWTETPELRVTETGRVARYCRRWYVNQTLDFLVGHGRARREPTLDVDNSEAYVLNDRFRMGLADISEALLIELRGSEEDPEVA